MNIVCRTVEAQRARPARRSRRTGSALVIILVLLSVMAALLVSNSVVLRRLRVELQLLEQKQKQGLENRTVVLKPQPGANNSTR